MMGHATRRRRWRRQGQAENSHSHSFLTLSYEATATVQKFLYLGNFSPFEGYTTTDCAVHKRTANQPRRQHQQQHQQRRSSAAAAHQFDGGQTTSERTRIEHASNRGGSTAHCASNAHRTRLERQHVASNLQQQQSKEN